MNEVIPFVRPFLAADEYQQDEPGDATFRSLLKKDEIPGLQIGLVTLDGPMHKTPGTHDEFHQVYLILSGSATVHVGGKSHRVDGPTVVVIPKHTNHSIEVGPDEKVQYAFVNQWAG
jgi:mannose-6-phosphate isomerase-like protein (cupin superfamily)